jgi:hypothetical protein
LSVGSDRVKAIDVFRRLVRPDLEGRYKYVQAVQNEIARTRGEKTKAQIYNQYIRFRNAVQNADYDSIEAVDKSGRVWNGSDLMSVLLKDIVSPIIFSMLLV